MKPSPHSFNPLRVHRGCCVDSTCLSGCGIMPKICPVGSHIPCYILNRAIGVPWITNLFAAFIYIFDDYLMIIHNFVQKTFVFSNKFPSPCAIGRYIVEIFSSLIKKDLLEHIFR